MLVARRLDCSLATQSDAQSLRRASRAGRRQLPADMLEPLGMRDRVRLEAEPDHIGVWPVTQQEESE